jgi:hypothetical protein
MAWYVKVDRQWLGHLIRGDRHVASMKIGDLLRCADKLGIALGNETPSPQCIERHVLRVVVQAMREQRRNGNTNGWPDLGDDEAENIRRLARTLGYIDDKPAREPTHWQPWLSHQARRFENPSSCLLTAVGLGDWLATQQYLPLFNRLLYSDIRALDNLADHHHNSDLKDFINRFTGQLGQALVLLRSFGSTTNGTIEEVARIRNCRPKAIEKWLGCLELTADDYRGENAVLSRLIIRSRILRDLFVDFLSHRERSLS